MLSFIVELSNAKKRFAVIFFTVSNTTRKSSIFYTCVSQRNIFPAQLRMAHCYLLQCLDSTETLRAILLKSCRRKTNSIFLFHGIFKTCVHQFYCCGQSFITFLLIFILLLAIFYPPHHSIIEFSIFHLCVYKANVPN